MNPILILIVVLIFSNKGSKPLNIPSTLSTPYFDTFKIELLLDRLHTITDALENINHLRSMTNLPVNKENSLDRIKESLDATRAFVDDSKAEKHLDTLSSTISGIKQFGDIENIMKSMGPIMSMLENMNEK